MHLQTLFEMCLKARLSICLACLIMKLLHATDVFMLCHFITLQLSLSNSCLPDIWSKRGVEIPFVMKYSLEETLQLDLLERLWPNLSLTT